MYAEDTMNCNDYFIRVVDHLENVFIEYLKKSINKWNGLDISDETQDLKDQRDKWINENETHIRRCVKLFLIDRLDNQGDMYEVFKPTDAIIKKYIENELVKFSKQ